jgi:hypothetical protein
MRYHPRVGYTYMPNAKLRVQGASGGYLVRTNAAGFRSDREFSPQRAAGCARALLFGDSQSAGDGVVNSLRFSDLLEQSVPNLEVFNYALSGSGTDQQFLAYEEQCDVEHDLVIIALYVENIRRLPARIVRSRDASGTDVFREKPYFELNADTLILRNVPVPKQAWTDVTLPAELRAHLYTYGAESSVFRHPTKGLASVLRAVVPAGGMRQAAKAVVRRLRGFQPLPEYNSADEPSWLLLRAVLLHWIRVSRTPVLIVPLPIEAALKHESDARPCQARFRELARDAACHLYDPLPDLLTLSDEARAALWSPAYGHFSGEGHALLATLLAPVVQRCLSERGAGATGAT